MILNEPFQTTADKGGGQQGQCPPLGLSGGGIAPPWDTGFEKKEGRTLKYYFIHIILNPNDPFLKTFTDYRLISTYWEIDSMCVLHTYSRN